MSMKTVPWARAEPPTEAAITQLLEAEGLRPHRWSNGPHYVYEAHTHPYYKILYVVQGAIVFCTPDGEQTATLNAGDRLEIPADVPHEARVGSEGVVCLEASRQ